MHTRNITLMSRLMGSTCFITVDGNGQVSGTAQPAPITAVPGADPVAHNPTPEVSAKDAPRDPGAPPETDAEKEARLANETPEQKAEREAAEADANKPAEEKPEGEKPEGEKPAQTDEEKAAEVEAKNKAWNDRDKTKDVAVTDEQKAQAKAMAATPEQEAAINDFTLEMNTTNELSPASRARAAEVFGVKPEMVDAYVASIAAQNNAAKSAEGSFDDTSEDPSKWSPAMREQFDLRMTALQNVAGGGQQWSEFSTWAEQGGITKDEMQALQAAITASPIVGATVAKNFVDRWKAEGNGGGPLDLTRGAGAGAQPQAKVQGFATRQEQNDAINDPRYAKDAAYRATVDARIVVSNFSQQNAEQSFYKGAGGMMGG